eukprot:TRINITY_DN3489_c0_g1_i2.p1 TRINITY_DN3489_c0_g1~~TRINITY_DN3489_c0_g1_i2.p1  ORF type:complete len:515 (+),score=137.19 TRINITY_DN3489_c0_g1_i2:145-1689(+)
MNQNDDGSTMRVRRESTLTVDIAGTVMAQLGAFSPAALSCALPSPAYTVPTPSHQVLTPEPFRGVATARNRDDRIPFPAPCVDDDHYTNQASPFNCDNVQICAQSPVQTYLQGQQYKHQQQQEGLLMRHQLEMQAQSSVTSEQLAENQMRINQMQQHVFNRGMQLAHVADQVSLQQQAQAVTNVTPPVQMPLESDERRLLSGLEERLMSPLYNLHEGSLSMVKLQDYLRNNHEKLNEEIVKKKYSGSFHKFVKANSNKFTYFYYSAEEIATHGLTHCDEHEGRLRFEDVTFELCMERDAKNAKWRKELVADALDEAEAIVREGPLTVKSLMMAFRERTTNKFLAVADSNHSLRMLVKTCDRFILTSESNVKLREHATEEELEQWNKKLDGEKTDKAQKVPKGKGKKKNKKNNGNTHSPHNSLGSASPPTSQLTHLSPSYGGAYGAIPYDSSSSATSTPASVPGTFHMYNKRGQFLGSPNVPFQQPIMDSLKAQELNLQHMPQIHHYQHEQFAQA